MKTIHTDRQDIASFGAFRVMRLLILSRIIPLGNLAGGGGVRSLVILALLHALGRPIFRLLVRHEQRLHSLYLLMKKYKD
jgi:hypothetical protein